MVKITCRHRAAICGWQHVKLHEVVFEQKACLTSRWRDCASCVCGSTGSFAPVSSIIFRGDQPAPYDGAKPRISKSKARDPIERRRAFLFSKLIRFDRRSIASVSADFLEGATHNRPHPEAFELLVSCSIPSGRCFHMQSDVKKTLPAFCTPHAGHTYPEGRSIASNAGFLQQSRASCFAVHAFSRQSSIVRLDSSFTSAPLETSYGFAIVCGFRKPAKRQRHDFIRAALPKSSNGSPASLTTARFVSPVTITCAEKV